MSLLAATRQWNILVLILRDLLEGKTIDKDCKRSKVLTMEEERLLMTLIKKMQQIGHPTSII